MRTTRSGVGATGRRYNFKDMLGERVGRLVVVREAAMVDVRPRWLCQCDCGREWVVEGTHLRAARRRGSKDYSCPACRRTKGKGQAT